MFHVRPELKSLKLDPLTDADKLRTVEANPSTVGPHCLFVQSQLNHSETGGVSSTIGSHHEKSTNSGQIPGSLLAGTAYL